MRDHLHEHSGQVVRLDVDHEAVHDLVELVDGQQRMGAGVLRDLSGADVVVLREEGRARDEGVLQGLCGRGSVPHLPDQQTLPMQSVRYSLLASRICGAQYLHEVHAGVGDVLELLVVEVGLLVEDGVVDVLHGLAEEGRRAGQQHVAQHAQGPHVAAVVVVAVQHLRGRVVAGAHLLGQSLVGREVLGQTEVDQDQRRVGVVVLEQEVLQLQVAVHDAVLVQVVDRAEHVAHELGGAVLPEHEALVLAGVQQLEQLPAAAQVGHDVHGALAEEHVLDLDDVGVVQALQDGDLRVQLAQVVAGDAVHVHHLHRSLVAGLAVGGQVHAAVAALALIQRCQVNINIP